MGVLVYGSSSEYEFDDRTLAHLKIAIAAKLRHQESFLVSWSIDPHMGSGRVSLWVSPAIPLQFRFAGSRPPTLNKTWINIMSQLSHSARGLVVVTENEAEAVAKGEARIPGVEAAHQD